MHFLTSLVLFSLSPTSKQSIPTASEPQGYPTSSQGGVVSMPTVGFELDSGLDVAVVMAGLIIFMSLLIIHTWLLSS